MAVPWWRYLVGTWQHSGDGQEPLRARQEGTHWRGGTDLESTNVYVRNLLRIMRDGQPTTLELAVQELLDLGSDPAKVSEAANLIRARNKEVQSSPRCPARSSVTIWRPGTSGPAKRIATGHGLSSCSGPRAGTRNPSPTLTIRRRRSLRNCPTRRGTAPTSARGLVLGYVQSGKTTNFTAVIAKAADAGYRPVIVLSGSP